MRLFSYIVRMDFGFAPNPFEGYCTLATCKSKIRSNAGIDDWVVGTGSVENVGTNKLIFAMKVVEKLLFDQYWNDERFECKKSNMNGSLKVRCGDNIYRLENGLWIQSDSRHSNKDGSENRKNKEKDLKSLFVLISDKFIYLGKNAIDIPNNFNNSYNERLTNSKKFGMHGFPSQFGDYERHIP